MLQRRAGHGVLALASWTVLRRGMGERAPVISAVPLALPGPSLSCCTGVVFPCYGRNIAPSSSSSIDPAPERAPSSSKLPPVIPAESRSVLPHQRSCIQPDWSAAAPPLQCQSNLGPRSILTPARSCSRRRLRGSSVARTDRAVHEARLRICLARCSGVCPGTAMARPERCLLLQRPTLFRRLFQLGGASLAGISTRCQSQLFSRFERRFEFHQDRIHATLMRRLRTSPWQSTPWVCIPVRCAALQPRRRRTRNQPHHQAMQISTHPSSSDQRGSEGDVGGAVKQSWQDVGMRYRCNPAGSLVASEEYACLLGTTSQAASSGADHTIRTVTLDTRERDNEPA
jgi:hypothetical protein